MKKKWIIVASVLVFAAVIGCAALGLGETIYLSSDGQRGWSLGAVIYNGLGWGAEAYRQDFGHHMEQRTDVHSWSQDDGSIEVAPDASDSYSRYSRHGNYGRSGHGGGGYLFFWLAVLGLGGYLLYRRQKQNQTSENLA